MTSTSSDMTSENETSLPRKMAKSSTDRQVPKKKDAARSFSGKTEKVENAWVGSRGKTHVSDVSLTLGEVRQAIVKTEAMLRHAREMIDAKAHAPVKHEFRSNVSPSPDLIVAEMVTLKDQARLALMLTTHLLHGIKSSAYEQPNATCPSPAEETEFDLSGR
jgi:hypothetical protein